MRTRSRRRPGSPEGEHGGEVIVISLGPERVRQSIKEALAKGADPRDSSSGPAVRQRDRRGRIAGRLPPAKGRKYD